MTTSDRAERTGCACTELPGGATLLGVHLFVEAKPTTFTMVEGRISHY